MANKLLDLQDAVNIRLAPLRVLEFRLNSFIEECEFPEGGFKNELFTMCDALHAGINSIEGVIENKS